MILSKLLSSSYSFCHGLRETWTAQVAPHLLNTDLRECDVVLEALKALAIAWLLDSHPLLKEKQAPAFPALEAGFNSAGFKGIRNTIAFMSTQIVN